MKIISLFIILFLTINFSTTKDRLINNSLYNNLYIINRNDSTFYYTKKINEIRFDLESKEDMLNNIYKYNNELIRKNTYTLELKNNIKDDSLYVRLSKRKINDI